VVAAIALAILLPVIALDLPFHRGAGRRQADLRASPQSSVTHSFPCLKAHDGGRMADDRLRMLLNRSRRAAEWLIDQKLRNDPAITPLGAFLQSILDELPLW